MNYNVLEDGVKKLKNLGLDVFSLGKSYLNNDVWCVRYGSSDKRKAIVAGGVHGREWITSPLVEALAEYEIGAKRDYTVFFVPISNPDGVRIALDGTEFIQDDRKRELIKSLGTTDFSLYKANGRGVDVNVNFPAKWGRGKSNVFRPASENYVGERPASETETRLLMNLTKSVEPIFTLAFHSKGEVVYYSFDDQSEEDEKRDYTLGKIIARETGYELMKSLGSAGGYKDWCVSVGIPSFTIEVGSDALSHPIGETELPTIFEETKNVVASLFHACDDLFFNRKGV